MNYDVFSGKFPVLEGDRIRLRPVERDDLEELYQLLQDPVVGKEYWRQPHVPSYQETRAIYSLNPAINYANKESITWAVALEESNKIIGLRDLFVDDDDKPVTVQGFIQKAYRGEGLSKEAYGLILDFARKNEVVGLLANTNAENIAAAALLCSVGFTIDYYHRKGEDTRLILSHNLQEYEQPLFWAEEEKIIYRFCRIYLQGEQITIVPDGFMQRDEGCWPCYRVTVDARSKFDNVWAEAIYATMEFVSDGVAILDLNSSGWISYIDGSIPLMSAVHYCWERCRL